MADAEVIARAAGGDASAFQMLVEQHRSMVYRVAYQFAGNHYDAEDIAQDVFIKVYRSLPRFRQDSLFTSWIYRIAMNACIDHRRRQMSAGGSPFGARSSSAPAGARFNEDAEQQMLNTPEEGPDPESTAYAGELGSVLEAAVRRLPQGQRIVFIMRHHEGLKLGEIASALGLAEGTVKRQLHAAIHRLRGVLNAANVTVGGRS
jgi:RNA polymerase sigma-70 factor (ECF subfamily)